MSSLDISLITLGCLLGGVLFGMWLQFRLPNHHLSRESQDTVKLGAGMVATMSALILGLLVSSAKNSFDTVNVAIAQNGARLVQLDHALADYGPETMPIRGFLKNSLAERVEKIWPSGKNAATGMAGIEKSTAMLDLQSTLRALTPGSEAQRAASAQAQQLCNEIWQNRLLIIEEQQEALPPVLLLLLVFWLTLLFVSFGLFAPRNVTVFAVLLVCALSVASAIFLIIEMSHPLDGFIKASKAPLVKALELMNP